MSVCSDTIDTAIRLFQERQDVSVSLLEHRFRIGRRAATELMAHLEKRGVVSSVLPEGFRVLKDPYLVRQKPAVPSAREIHAQRVFETAAFLMEIVQSDHGNGHSDAYKQIKPSHVIDWKACRRAMPSIAESGSITLLDLCERVAGLKDEGCVAPEYAFDDVRDVLADLCNWWAPQALPRAPAGDLSEFRYAVSLLRQARYLYRIYQDAGHSGGGWSRFDIFVDEGQAPRSTSHRWEAALRAAVAGQPLPPCQDEHVVPLAFIRDHCLHLYELGASIRQVAGFIRDHLVIVRMLKEESALLDASVGAGGRGLKITMPPYWRPGIDDIFARLHDARIGFTPPPGFLR